MPGSQRTPRPSCGTSLFVVLVLDPVTDDLDSYGPYAWPAALREATRRRDEFDGEDLGDVLVLVVPLHTDPPHVPG
jgi:hypothetical protein